MNKSIKLCYEIKEIGEHDGFAPSKSQWDIICKKIKSHKIVKDDDNEDIIEAVTFIIWLSGFIELSNPKMVTETQWKKVINNLKFITVIPKVRDNIDKPKKQKPGFTWLPEYTSTLR